MGPSDRVCLATMVCVCSSDDAKDGIIVRLCIFESLEDDRSNCICPAVAAGPIIKRITIAYKPMSAAELEPRSE